jgi:hypothetical protein
VLSRVKLQAFNIIIILRKLRQPLFLLRGMAPVVEHKHKALSSNPVRLREEGKKERRGEKRGELVKKKKESREQFLCCML